LAVTFISEESLSTTKKLVIVESPAKAKTIGKYLGDDYEVLASVGHIRDIPTPKELPVDMKKGPYGKFAVNVDKGFDAYYVVSENSKRTVAELKRALKNADELYLATDEDREGEAIAWHLLEVLKPKVPVHRMVFHEITKDAIEAARQNTRELDRGLVDAQETRRILDRLVGFEVSPVLWRMVGKGLSAGRVQSVTTRLVVDRERERMAFTSANYWDLTATLSTGSGTDAAANQFVAKLMRIGGTPIASGRDFDDNGTLSARARALSETEARTLADAMRLPSASCAVTKLETKPYSKRPAAPFTTSTLQQEGVNKLGFSSRQTMSVAQRLYENGHITYMRTDSPSLSVMAMNAARSQASSMYGADQVPDAPRLYSGKNKNAQEAHEAIRPAGETFKTPAELSTVLRGEELKLYELIWKRTVASQMADAKGQTATVTIAATAEGFDTAEFTASGTVITFRGFMNAYEEEIAVERNAPEAPADAKLPQMTEGQTLVLAEVSAKGHDTSPPARFTEASIVKKLEELGIGRPSTYASTISTIMDRGYVTSKGKALVPSWIAFVVVRLMEESFADLVSYDFTAAMEDDLDRIANGQADRGAWLKDFYFGAGEQRGLLATAENLITSDKQSLNSVVIADDITLRIWPTNAYLEIDEPGAAEEEPKRKIYLPDGMAPDELTEARARELAAAPVAGDRVLGINPDNGKQVVAKDGRFGPYVTEVDLELAAQLAATEAAEALAAKELAAANTTIDPVTGEVIEPKAPKKKAKVAPPKERTASLFKSMDPSTVDFETALSLLNLPREVGADPETGDMILAQNGRFGAYLKKGTDTRSLDNETQIFGIDLSGALEKFAQPKYGARQGASSIAEFEADPTSGKPIKVKDGRFGPYVTDGETNATIPRGEKVEEVDYERAIELLAEKRAKGPAVPRAKKAPVKKPAAKKPAAKKPVVRKAAGTTAAKKPATKKPAARKPAAKTPAATTTNTIRKGTVAKRAPVAKTGLPSSAEAAARPVPTFKDAGQ
jgi:DNA topoisomerase-1